MSQFTLNKSTGALGLSAPLDREKLASVQLVLKATQDCSSGRWEVRPRGRAAPGAGR